MWGSVRIFISYRRDHHGTAVQVRNLLAERFGAEALYFDLGIVPADRDANTFPVSLNDNVRACDVFVALIDRDWQAHATTSWAAEEVVSAIAERKCLLPVFLDGANPARATPALPEKLHELLHWEASFVLTSPPEHFQQDLEAIVRRIAALRCPGRTRRARALLIAPALVCAAIGLGLWGVVRLDHDLLLPARAFSYTPESEIDPVQNPHRIERVVAELEGGRRVELGFDRAGAEVELFQPFDEAQPSGCPAQVVSVLDRPGVLRFLRPVQSPKSCRQVVQIRWHGEVSASGLTIPDDPAERALSLPVAQGTVVEVTARRPEEPWPLWLSRSENARDVGAILVRETDLPWSFSCNGAREDELRFEDAVAVKAVTVERDVLSVSLNARGWDKDANPGAACSGPALLLRAQHWSFPTVVLGLLGCLLPLWCTSRTQSRCRCAHRKADQLGAKTSGAAVAGLALLATLALTQAAQAAPSGRSILITSDLACPGAATALEHYQTQVRASAERALGVPGHDYVSLRNPTKAELLSTLAEQSGFVFLAYSGHGNDPDGRSAICVADAQGRGQWLSVTDLLRGLPKTARGAVVLLNACMSAQVDPRQAPIDTSIMSASPFLVSTGGLFAEGAFAALVRPGLDANCDGVATDQELFEETAAELARRFPLARRNAMPKLRRQAASPIPLPITPAEAPDRCGARAGSPIELSPSAGLRAFHEQLAIQLAPEKGLRPRLDHDFYLLRAVPGCGRREDAALLTRALDEAGLVALGEGERAQARLLAARADFAEIYDVELRCGWVRVTRLRDGVLWATRPTAKLAEAVPRRTTRSFSRGGLYLRDNRYDAAERFLRLAPGNLPHPPVPCFEPEGQCFALPVGEP